MAQAFVHTAKCCRAFPLVLVAELMHIVAVVPWKGETQGALLIVVTGKQRRVAIVFSLVGANGSGAVLLVASLTS